MKLQTLTLLSLASADVARLRGSPAALARLLRRKTGRSSLGRYWHGVQYLLAGGAAEVSEPLAWLTEGGEVLGRNELGDVRYLEPAQAARLAQAFVDELPDELGDDAYDEAAMDEARVYPGCWRRLSRTYDPLGTLRELYSYARTFLEARLHDRKGVVLFLEEEHEEFDAEEGDDDEGAPAQTPEPEAHSSPSGDTILAADQGRRYAAADAARELGAELLAQVDAGLGALGYRLVGDFTMTPLLAGGFVRSYVSADGSSAGFVILSAERGVASTTLSSRLPGDALVQVSDAFLQERRKVKFFGTTVSRGTPAQLHAALLERRSQLEPKLGPAVTLARTLATTAEQFELYWSKITKRK